MNYAEANPEVLEHSPNVFYSRTAEHALTRVSPRIEEFLGVDAGKSLVKGMYFLTDNPANLEGMRPGERVPQTAKRLPSHELEMIGHDGCKHWGEVTERPVNRDSITVAMVRSFRDISEEKVAWNTHDQSEQCYRELFERTPEGTCVIAEGRFAFANNAIEKVPGPDLPQKLIGKQLLRFLSPAFHDIAKELVGESWNKGKFIGPFIAKIIRRDGFFVDVAGTGASPCALSLGPGELQCVIAENARVRTRL